jgi:hypothetical protein
MSWDRRLSSSWDSSLSKSRPMFPPLILSSLFLSSGKSSTVEEPSASSSLLQSSKVFLFKDASVSWSQSFRLTRLCESAQHRNLFFESTPRSSLMNVGPFCCWTGGGIPPFLFSNGGQTLRRHPPNCSAKRCGQRSGFSFHESEEGHVVVLAIVELVKVFGRWKSDEPEGVQRKALPHRSSEQSQSLRKP